MKRCILLWVLLLLCAGCGESINGDAVASVDSTTVLNTNYTRVTIRSYNEKGQFYDAIYTKEPRRIVAVWQNSIETLIALGEGKKIVAGIGIPDVKYVRPEYRVAYENIPYKSLENLDLETILMMKADFMVGWWSTFTPKTLQTAEFWHRRGVHTYIAASSFGDIPETQTIETEYQYIRDLGSIFHKELIAESLIHDMEYMITHTVENTASETPPTVAFVELQGKMLRLYGIHTLAGNIGIRLHAHVMDLDSSLISMEDLIRVNPDVIFLIVSDGSYRDADAQMSYLIKQPSLQGLQAIRNHRVHFLPLLAVYSPGIRLSDGITIISHGLYPHVYPEGVPDYLH